MHHSVSVGVSSTNGSDHNLIKSIGERETSKNETLKDRVAYKERIVFATMRNLIPQWEQPSDWNELTDEKKMERLEKIEELNK